MLSDDIIKQHLREYPSEKMKKINDYVTERIERWKMTKQASAQHA